MDRIETDEHQPSEMEFDVDAGGAPELPRATLAEPRLPLQSLTGAATEPSAPAPAAVASSSGSSQAGQQKRPLDQPRDRDAGPKRVLGNFAMYAQAVERLAAGTELPSECPICNLDTKGCPPIVCLKRCSRPHWICLGCLYGVLVDPRGSKRCPQCVQPISYLDVLLADRCYTGARIGMWISAAANLHLMHKSCSFISRSDISLLVAGAVSIAGMQWVDTQLVAALRKYLSIEAATAVELAASSPLPSDMQGHTLRLAPLSSQFLPYCRAPSHLHRIIRSSCFRERGVHVKCSIKFNWLGLVVGIDPTGFKLDGTVFDNIISVANDVVGRRSVNANLSCGVISAAETTGVAEDGSTVNILQYLVTELLHKGHKIHEISHLLGPRSTALVLQALELDSPADYAAEYRRLLVEVGTSSDVGAYFYRLCKKYELVDASHAEAVLDYLLDRPNCAATLGDLHEHLGGTNKWIELITGQLCYARRFGRRVRAIADRNYNVTRIELCLIDPLAPAEGVYGPSIQSSYPGWPELKSHPPTVPLK